jgi:MarR family transcriptional regulator, organic hydroperoxide resistance regulator
MEMAKDRTVGLAKQDGTKPGRGVDGADVNVASLILSQAFVNWHKAFMKVLDPYKLTYSQWIILQTLMSCGESMSPSELNKYLTIEGTSISVLIDGIEKRGFIRRRRSRLDRRMVKVSLTGQGQELLAEIDPQISMLIENIYGLLSAGERKQLIELCRKIRDASVKNNGGNPDIVEAILMKFSGAGR